LETFVCSEILRQSEWFLETSGLYLFRDKDQNEVDAVVKDLAGQVVGTEVKASATVRREDFRGLKRLASACGEDFRLGVILYDGNQVFPFGEGLFAAPIPSLWA
jgi:predicted AAA+ superfamily ATPase